MKESKAETKSYSLHVAAANGKVGDIIKLIEQQHFYIDEKMEFTNDTPLLYAAAEGQVEAVVYLLAKGADVYACDRSKANCVHKICFEINDDRTSVQQRAQLRKTLGMILSHEKRLRETDANVALQHGYLLDDKDGFKHDPLYWIKNPIIRKDIEDLIEEVRNAPVSSSTVVVTEQKSPTASEQKQPGQPAVESLEKPRSSSDPSPSSSSSLRRRVPSGGAEALKSFQPDSSIGGNSPPPVSSKTYPVQKQQSGLLARIWSIFAPSEQTFASDALSKNQEKTALLTKGK